jgi:NAD(P)-dependent dehydrogenase (short-subunit alcohol dehydrogenase family)
MCGTPRDACRRTLGQRESIAVEDGTRDVLVFLASCAAGLITGASLLVDGGWAAQ